MKTNQSKFDDVLVRTVTASESSAASRNRLLPLVIEARKDRHLEFLKAFLSSHSEALVQTVQEHGAILFRGFRIKNERDFEEAVCRIKPFVPMDGYFMSEPGRTLVQGTQNVFHTNALYKTGGGFIPIAAFHTENFYSLDVPRFQSFWCKTPATLGGETGLLDMVHAYERLPDDAKETFEEQSVVVAKYPIEDIARRYGLSRNALASFFSEAGLEISPDGEFLAVSKPCIFLNPETGKKSLLIHLSSPAIPGRFFDPAVRESLMTHYSGWQWSLHRFLWKHPALLHLVLHRELPRKPPKQARPREEIQAVMTQAQATAFGRKMAQNISLFVWRPGDLLLIDNSRTAHLGMPGMGPRTLRVLLGSPIPLPYPLSSGVWKPSVDRSYESFEVRLRRLRREDFVVASPRSGRSNLQPSIR